MATNSTAYVDNSLLGFAKDVFEFVSPFLVLFLIIPSSTWWLWSITSYFSSPLKKYPGPVLAISTGDSHLVLENLHKKYGPIVRITPSIIDVDIPEIIKIIFSIKGDWLKTPFYHGSSALVNGQIVLNIFSQTDPAKHRKERQPIAKLYSSAGISTLEPHMDKVINQLCRELEERFMDGDNAGKICNIGRWILFYTWDVVGAVTFSRPIGYVEKGYDFDGTLRNADKAMDYFSVVGTMPFLDRLLDKNPICHIGPPGFNTIAEISVKHLVDRYQGNDKHYHDPQQPDFLDKFIEVKNAKSDEADDAQIISWLMINMIAGADTTAVTIRSALYFGLKHPRVWRRLTDEILAAGFWGQTPPVYKDVKALPYTDAVIREALRMLPGVAMSMERYVPKEGFTLPNGDFLPGGTILGMNPYILARNKSIYGEDAHEFRPERWLRDDEHGEDEERFQKRLLMMNQADLSFGGGSRICIGKQMGLFQTYKVFATLVTLYEIELADPQKEWKTCQVAIRSHSLSPEPIASVNELPQNGNDK
ncbi:cytochrome P450 monooxygenase [Fusarium mundagurra]|uniref:Cytochrome P450 monooxygenase n=1 Tax=Fusarium mundagurra TaxID=1567541 RepID=A0A8H5Z7L5_9HYPO|nr:cytochrome P450 monooxygenase [Fusarium mundagurra]